MFFTYSLTSINGLWDPVGHIHDFCFVCSDPSVDKNWYWREYIGLRAGIFSLKDLGQNQDKHVRLWSPPEFVNKIKGRMIQTSGFLFQFIGGAFGSVIILLPEIG